MYLLLCHLLIPAYNWKGSLHTTLHTPDTPALPSPLFGASKSMFCFRHVFMLSTICNARISSTHLPLDAVMASWTLRGCLFGASSFLPLCLHAPYPPFTSLRFTPLTSFFLMYIFTAVGSLDGQLVGAGTKGFLKCFLDRRRMKKLNLLRCVHSESINHFTSTFLVSNLGFLLLDVF
jgi:hypothetical protein